MRGYAAAFCNRSRGGKPYCTGSCRSIWYGAEHIARHGLYLSLIHLYAIPGDDNLFSRQIPPIDDQWWKAFADPKLDSLITVASTQNYSVLSATDRMDMAKSNLRIERGSFFPSISLDGGWAVSYTHLKEEKGTISPDALGTLNFRTSSMTRWARSPAPNFTCLLYTSRCV